MFKLYFCQHNSPVLLLINFTATCFNQHWSSSHHKTYKRVQHTTALLSVNNSDLNFTFKKTHKKHFTVYKINVKTHFIQCKTEISIIKIK